MICYTATLQANKDAGIEPWPSVLKGTFKDTTGLHPELKGKTALLREVGDHYIAQFDDMAVPQAYGWWGFAKQEFDVVRVRPDPASL